MLSCRAPAPLAFKCSSSQLKVAPYCGEGGVEQVSVTGQGEGGRAETYAREAISSESSGNVPS